MIAKTDTLPLILDLLAISVARSAYSLATLCATALANFYCDASLRKAALADLPRVSGVLLPALAVSATTVDLQETQYQVCRVVRELVGKTDAALINAALDSIVQSNLLKQAVVTAFTRAPGEPVSLALIGMLMTVLAEIGRSAVRPRLVAELLRPVFDQLMLIVSTTRLINSFDVVYPTSVVLTQLALLPGFVASLSVEQIGAIGHAGSSLLKYLDSGRNSAPILFDSTNRAALAIVHMFAAVRDKSSLVVPEVSAPLPAELEQHELIIAAAHLLFGRPSVAECKRQLGHMCESVSKRRVDGFGLTKLELPQFIQQRATWTETSDVFGIGNALQFEANAFDSLENVARANEWLAELNRHHSWSTQQAAAPAFGVKMLFKVAGLVAMRSTRRFASPEALKSLLGELIDIGGKGYIAYPFATGSMLETVVTILLKNK